MVDSSDSKGSSQSPLEILKITFGRSLENLSRQDKFTLIALLGQVARNSERNYSLMDAYRELPGENISRSLFQLLPQLSENLSIQSLLDLCGKLIEVIHLPGACVCRPVIKGDYLYAAVLRSPDLGAEKTGFVTILDKQNKVVSNIGGTPPVYDATGKLQPMAQAEKIFIHPHDVCVDSDENLYVAQWASGKVYPYKFKRV